MKIGTQNIYGGNQQFADTIVNQHPAVQFSSNDVELLKFVGSTPASSEEKQKIAQDVATINKPDVADAEKQTAVDRIKKFLLAHEGDLKKWAGIITKASLAIILAKFGLKLSDIGLD